MSVLKTTHKMDDEMNFITPRGRMTFVALDKKFKSKDSKPGDDGQYAVALLIDADANLDLLYSAADALAKSSFPSMAAVKKVNSKAGIFGGLGMPFHAADEKLSAEEHGVDSLEGRVLIRANSYKYKPGVRDSQGVTVETDELSIEAYPGRYARMEVRLASYDSNGNKGIKLYVQGVQLLAKGERLKGSGPSGTADSFKTPVVDDEDDDAALA